MIQYEGPETLAKAVEQLDEALDRYEQLRREADAAWDSAEHNQKRAEKAEAESQRLREALKMSKAALSGPSTPRYRRAVLEAIDAAMLAEREVGG